MKLALVHHAEKKRGMEDPELTAFGIQQANQSALFLANHIQPSVIWYTQTKRTRQTATILHDHFPSAPCYPCREIPEQWDEWMSFIQEFLQKDSREQCFVCHHTTIQMCKKQFNIPLFLSCFSSVIILEKIAEQEWICSTFRQGEISL